MNKELLWANLLVMFLVFHFLYRGMRKLNGCIFFQESNQMTVVYAIITALFEIKKMDFSIFQDIEYSAAFVLLYSIPLLIIVGGTYFNLRKKSMIVYDISKGRIVQVLKDVFLRYRMVLEQESGEDLKFQVKEQDVTVKLSAGNFDPNKWTIEINKYRRLLDFELIMEDIKNAIYEKEEQRKRYRGIMDICLGIAVFIGLAWFHLKF
ncbi:hypothetical protein HNQ80_002340 [Anaerosolibacter carboniphilus]|uniref:Uncharacterized protein n=1 Tax=Anaerosolibacter carboniphilus TaxID=1417629 RepID=A0A841KS75_9FIRM|nr:hypothetical protein [Anaerosolibacter carboniphilus]MBB6216241.1 hypothetical protein [Anaerosolibacter carboniphilus]